jgi:hypothetical protein
MINVERESSMGNVLLERGRGIAAFHQDGDGKATLTFSGKPKPKFMKY